MGVYELYAAHAEGQDGKPPPPEIINYRGMERFKCNCATTIVLL